MENNEFTRLSNSEKKKIVWDGLKHKYSHLEMYCNIELQGIDDESIYFHPKFILDEDTYISCQSDCDNNKVLYAFRFTTKNNDDYLTIEIGDDIVSPIIAGYATNRDMVMLALSTLTKIREHIVNLNIYATDYISNLLIGNSVKELTQSFINELSTTEKMIEFMQKQKKQ